MKTTITFIVLLAVFFIWATGLAFERAQQVQQLHQQRIAQIDQI